MTIPKLHSALKVDIVAKCSTTKARLTHLHLPHFAAHTPMFMPVGTQGTMKGLTTVQLENLDCHVILGNTYHLALRPGQEIMNIVGGLHQFMNWKRGLLTDSGGFQMVSLLDLAEITEDGVRFLSPHDGSPMLLTPEKSIEMQNAIHADIMMQLDDVVCPQSSPERIEEAMWRSIRWLDRCIKAHKKPDTQNLFAIVQGGLDVQLRRICAQEMMKRDTPGYAIGGLSGGEDKNIFWRIVSVCTDELPEDKPRYCMGVGYSEDLVVCSALGVDMYDCVFPTRTARFGNALTRQGSLNLKLAQNKTSFIPIDQNCTCPTCSLNPNTSEPYYTRSHLYHLLATKETVACHLISLHNIAYQMRLMKDIRESILGDRFPAFIKQFMQEYYKNDSHDAERRKKSDGEWVNGYPKWIADALSSVGVELD